MTQPYPMEMRQRAVRFVEAGQSRHEVAERLGVSVSSVVKWLLLHKATGSVKGWQAIPHGLDFFIPRISPAIIPKMMPPSIQKPTTKPE